VIWRLMAVLAMMCLLAGCSHLKNLVKGDPEVRVHPASKKSFVWGKIHEVEHVTGLKWGKHDWDIYYVPATHYQGGRAAITSPDWGIENGKPVGGWTALLDGTIKTKMAMYSDGRLGPRTLMHELARGVYIDNGYSAIEYEPEMKRLGLW